MKQVVGSFIILVFLSACAGSAPTAKSPSPAPTRPIPTVAPVSTTSPKPPVAGAPTKAPIIVKDLKQATQPNGTVRTTGNVTAEGDLGVGQMDLASPEAMVIYETAPIILRISPAQQLTNLTPVAVPVKTPDLPSFVYKFTGNIQVYPVMFAELRALQFSIDQPGPIRRNIESSNRTVEWTWLISPKAAGQQSLAIELSIPTIVNGTSSELSTSVLRGIPIIIRVSSVAPTPEPLVTRIGNSLVDNAGPLLIALIGLIGTIIGIVYRMRTSEANKKPPE